jgi:hypothetical protein
MNNKRDEQTTSRGQHGESAISSPNQVPDPETHGFPRRGKRNCTFIPRKATSSDEATGLFMILIHSAKLVAL